MKHATGALIMFKQTVNTVAVGDNEIDSNKTLRQLELNCTLILLQESLIIPNRRPADITSC